MIRALLLDVGGTLWANSPPAAADAHVTRLAHFAALGVPAEKARPLMHDLGQLPEASSGGLQTTFEDVDRVLHRRDLGGVISTEQAVRAMCLPAGDRFELFAGAIALLQTAKRLGLSVVIVSNVYWRGRASYLEDFDALGCDGLIDHIITSLDVGAFKPHPRVFDTAVSTAACAPTSCVFVGDSEINDIAPASALGMKTVLVAIEEPPPSVSAADAVVTSLDEVSQLLVAWCGVR